MNMNTSNDTLQLNGDSPYPLIFDEFYCPSFELKPSLFEIPSIINKNSPSQSGSTRIPATGNIEETSPVFDDNGIPSGFKGSTISLEEVRKISIVLEDGNDHKKITIFTQGRTMLRERKKFVDSNSELSRTRVGRIGRKRNSTNTLFCW